MDLAAADWQLYRSFLAVMQEGSLSGAARKLGLTQPTLGRQIAQLEQALGLPLFSRSPAGLEPTAAATTLIPHAEAMASAAQALARAASGAADETKGTIRLTASEFMSAEVLPPMLADFQDRHRGIVIELAGSNRVEDLLRRDADLAVRMKRPAQDALIAKHIGHIPIRMYAHRRYIERRGIPKTLLDLPQHTVIGFDRDDSSFRAVGASPFEISRDLFSFRTDDDVVQHAALRGGVGIGGCQVGVARRNSDLVPVLHDAIQFTLEMWLVTHEDLKADRRVRLLFDHLSESLTAYAKESAT
ncbi:MAG TPA: LysR family transcriptional regulator [Magnetospirillaceae bacterium]|jgi:DNA-binding transcriptional LysR family regulator